MTWEVAEVSVATIQSGTQWEIAEISVAVTGGTQTTFRVSDNFSITEGNTSDYDFSYQEIFTVTDGMPLRDSSTLVASPRRTFMVLDRLESTDSNQVNFDSALHNPGGSDLVGLSDQVRMVFRGSAPSVYRPAEHLSDETLKRQHFAYAQNIEPEYSKLSTTDIEFKYYSERSGLTFGSLSDHRQAWLRNQGYETMYEFLEGRGFIGDLGSKLRKYWSAYEPRTDSNTTDELLVLGGSNLGDADLGGF